MNNLKVLIWTTDNEQKRKIISFDKLIKIVLYFILKLNKIKKLQPCALGAFNFTTLAPRVFFIFNEILKKIIEV